MSSVPQTMNTPALTLTTRLLAYRLNSLSINMDGTIGATLLVGSVDEAGAFKKACDHHIHLNSIDAAPVLQSRPDANGQLSEQITAALIQVLSSRGDWIA